MSMVAANVAQILTQEIEVPEATPRRYKARMATKVRWLVGDAMEQSILAQERIKKIWEWIDEMRAIADTTDDVRLLLLFGKLEHELLGLKGNVGEIERILTTAIAESKPEKPKSKYSEL